MSRQRYRGKKAWTPVRRQLFSDFLAPLSYLLNRDSDDSRRPREMLLEAAVQTDGASAANIVLLEPLFE